MAGPPALCAAAQRCAAVSDAARARAARQGVPQSHRPWGRHHWFAITPANQGRPQRSSAMNGWGNGVWGRGQASTAILLVATLAGCSSSSIDSAPAPSASGGSSFRARMNNLFFGSSDAQAQANVAESTADPNQDCPIADVRSGASTLQINAPGEKSTSTVRYQA